MVIRNFPRWWPAAILDLVQPEVGPFDPPTWKTLHYNQTWSGSDDPLPRYGRSNFSKMRGRSVSRSSVLNIIHCSHTLLFATLGTTTTVWTLLPCEGRGIILNGWNKKYSKESTKSRQEKSLECPRSIQSKMIRMISSDCFSPSNQINNIAKVFEEKINKTYIFPFVKFIPNTCWICFYGHGASCEGDSEWSEQNDLMRQNINRSLGLL